MPQAVGSANDPENKTGLSLRFGEEKSKNAIVEVGEQVAEKKKNRKLSYR